jgi:hypothetical protein
LRSTILKGLSGRTRTHPVRDNRTCRPYRICSPSLSGRQCGRRFVSHACLGVGGVLAAVGFLGPAGFQRRIDQLAARQGLRPNTLLNRGQQDGTHEIMGSPLLRFSWLYRAFHLLGAARRWTSGLHVTGRRQVRKMPIRWVWPPVEGAMLRRNEHSAPRTVMGHQETKLET